MNYGLISALSIILLIIASCGKDEEPSTDAEDFGSFAVESDQSIESEERQKPCINEVLELCSGVPRNPKAIGQCLRSNRDQLSSQCLARIQKAKGNFSTVKKSCGAEVKELCLSSSRGFGKAARIIQCVMRNFSQLSSSCQTAIQGLVQGFGS